MDNLLNVTGRPRSLSQETDEPTKRISTPAGLRLSVIMENTIDQKSRPRRVSKSGTLKSGNVSKGSTLVGDPRESKEERISGPMGYSYDIFSEKVGLPTPSLSRRIKTSNFIQRKGGWKRVLLLAIILLLCIIAVAVGAAVGLKQNKKNDDHSGSPVSTTVPANAGAAVASPTASTGSSPTSSTQPSGFPVGTYSFSTFLDTVTTDCTSNPSTWSCFPYTIYNTNHTKALSTFNWVIKQGSSAGSYSISSLDNPFGINFQNAAMKLLDKGGDSERYQFQIQMEKSVVPSPAITDDGSAATCLYNSTTMTGYLYTNRSKDYPAAGDNGDATYPTWPYAVRVEQTVAGGDGVPTCYQGSNDNLGAQVGSFKAEDPSTLCSCLYRNFLTPGT